jgi:DNA mismatch endonuclease (patch repair protein)
MRAQLETDRATSLRMAGIRQKGTNAELRVRRVAWLIGLRYRLCNRALPGSPDLANRSRGWAVFVNGCFWHRHAGCRRATVPKRNASFWIDKFKSNVERDQKAQRSLRSLGFTVVVVWECETASDSAIRRKLRKLNVS